jgi:branched-chain amino acid transport system ATP-binding protein
MALILDGIVAGYDSTDVLCGVSLTVQPGQVVALVGSNGAGKTSVLRSISGYTTVRSGRVEVDGLDLLATRPDQRAAIGVGHVLEGRQLFPQMSVGDNLTLGAYRRRDTMEETLAEVLALFPILEQRRQTKASSLSGGQAQMLAIGRALMARPKYLLLDEPSLGLSPMMVDHVFSTIAGLAERGVGILLAEQNAARALAMAGEAHVMENGRIALSGDGPSLLSRPEVVDSYLGGAVH